MRQRCWWRTLAFAASFALTGGFTAAQAQSPYGGLYGEAYAEPAPVAAPVAAQDASAEFRAILARLDAQERELNSLRALVNQGTPAREASLSADGAAAADEGPCKKVDLVTKPAFKIAGRLYVDAVMFEDHPNLVGIIDRQNEFGFGTARIGVAGDVYENVVGKIEVEYEGTEVDFKDVYIEATNAPILGTVKAGHFKEPFSLEELTSSRFITFMNRSVMNSLVPGRNFGVMANNDIRENDNWSWFVGTFRHESDDSPTGRASQIDDNGDWVFTGRLAGLLFYDEPSKGRYLVHVGGSFSHRQDSTVASFSQKAEIGSQNGYLSSTFTGDRDWNMYGAEAAIVWGPGSIQAEFTEADTDNGLVNGGYIEASYFITGENRGYKKSSKAFDRVKPLEDFFRVSTANGVCMGRGAWQVAARYSWLDFNEGLAGTRGFYDGFTAGVNWYWNPYTRMMFDYLHEDVNLITGVDGANDNFGMRWQFDY